MACQDHQNSSAGAPLEERVLGRLGKVLDPVISLLSVGPLLIV